MNGRMTDELEDIEHRLVAVLREVRALREKVRGDTQTSSVPWYTTLTEGPRQWCMTQIVGHPNA